MMRIHVAGRESGSALFTAVIVTILLGTLSLLFMTVSTRHQQEGSAANRRMNSFYAAEAGLNVAWVELQNGGDGVVGSQNAPETLGGLEFYVEANDLGSGLVSLVATGSDGHAQSRVELVAEDASAGISDFGIFGERAVTIASNAKIDSYNSDLGTYASQVSGDHALANGNVGSNDSISVASNAKVWGYAQYGPDASDSISIGSSVTLANGYGPAEEERTLDPIVVPSYPNSGALTLSGRTPVTIGPGNLQYTSITTRSNTALIVRGPCNLVITTGATISSNSSWTFDATNGPINVYATNNFDLRSNSTVTTTTQDPTQLTLYLSGVHASSSSSSPTINFSSNSSFYGTIHAPDLSVEISSNFELFGSLAAQWIRLASNSRVHYDEALATGALDSGSGWEIRAWRQLEGEQTATSLE
jgi:hypothetical protein